MAYIDNIYVHVTDESITRGVEISEHPVEKGYTIADNVKAKATVISLTGEIVPFASVGSMSRLKMIIAALDAKQKSGALVTYSGTATLENAVINEFTTTASNKIAGGYAFTMTIREIKVAAPAYVAQGTTNKSTKLGTQQVQKKTVNTWHVCTAADRNLWNLSLKYYGDGQFFQDIYNANSTVVKSPGALLKAGWRLFIP